MNNLEFHIRRSYPYRLIRNKLYYLFEYKKRNAFIDSILSGKNKDYSYLQEYKNIHEGKRCFIIATGPSLTKEELELVRHEYTFGVNALCLKFNELNWKTNYFVISDKAAYDKLSPTLNELRMPFFSAYKSNDEGEYCVFIPTDIHNSYMIQYEKKEFTNNIETGCGNGNTVVLQAIQIAVYMGFKEIYLLGVDCNYDQSKGKLYFVDHGIRGFEQKGAGARMIADFQRLSEYQRKWGINIFNASTGGMLEVFPRVNLREIIAKGQNNE